MWWWWWESIRNVEKQKREEESEKVFFAFALINTCTICTLRISEPELEMKAATYENLPNNYATTQ